MQDPEQKVRILGERLLKEIEAAAKSEVELFLERGNFETQNDENERIKADHAKEKSQRHNLESLCQEMQRQNKQIMEDSNKIANEEKQKRVILAQNFQTSITEITQKLEENNQERIQLLQFHELLRDRLKQLIDHVEQQDDKFKQELEEKTKLLEDYRALLEAPPNEREIEMRKQLAEYKDKFEVFQESLLNSNEQFGGFKKDMDSKAKQLRQIQKDSHDIKKRLIESEETLKNMRREAEHHEKEKEGILQQIAKLENFKNTLL